MDTAPKKHSMNYKLPVTLVLLILAAALNFVGSEIIYKYFGDRPVPPDLLFRLLPHLGWTQMITDIMNIAIFLLLIYYLARYLKGETPFYLACYALAYFLRAVMIILTPLGAINGGDGSFYGIHFVKQLGAFPSGHTIMVCLAFFLIDRQKHLAVSNLALVLMVVEIISLLTSRGHYSIDVVGGYLVAYFSYNVLLKFRRQLIAA